MQAVNNSHLIGNQNNALNEDEKYGPKTTVWHVAADVIRTASGAPIWKFIELKKQEQKKITKAEMVEILSRINVAGSTISHSDELGEILGENKKSENSTLVINLDYVPNLGPETKNLFSIAIRSDLNASITYQDHLGQYFMHKLKLAA